MIIYRVTITLEAAIESEWVAWMTGVHIPDVLRTGCFSDCRTYKLLEPHGDEVVYAMDYTCFSLAEYHRYRDSFAPALQKEHADRFDGRCRGTRQVLQEVVNKG